MGATAYSIDGRVFEFRASVEAGLTAGRYVVIEDPGGSLHLGQILDVTATPGTTFADPVITGSGALVGESSGTPFTNASVRPAPPEAVASGVGGDASTGLRLGSLADLPEVEAVLRTTGLGRHTFVCGQSGSGKTYAMGKVLERVLQDTDLRIIVLDPNSDYVHVGELRDQDDTGLGDEDYDRALARQRTYADRVKVVTRGKGLRMWLGNLTRRQQLTVLGLDPIADAEETDVATRIMAELESTTYTPADMRRHAEQMAGEPARRLALRIGNLGLEQMDIWADEEHGAILDELGDDWRAAVLDLGSLLTPVERSIVAAAVVSMLWRRRHDRDPVLLVVDEAHNICPQEPTDRHQALATEHLVTIAGEGRKFGIYLMVATQRPGKVHENVLTQCDNLLLMRMNSTADIAGLAAAFSAVPTSLIRQSGVFRLGEGLAFGKISPQPIFFRTGRRISPEGGTDVPATWATVT